MSMPGKKIILVLVAFVVVAGGGIALWQGGMLPFVPGRNIDVAAADTTGTVATDDA